MWYIAQWWVAWCQDIYTRLYKWRAEDVCSGEVCLQKKVVEVLFCTHNGSIYNNVAFTGSFLVWKKEILGTYLFWMHLAMDNLTFTSENACRASPRRQKPCMQKIFSLVQMEQSGERPAISTKIKSSSQSVVHSRSSRWIYKDGSLLQTVWTVC